MNTNEMLALLHKLEEEIFFMSLAAAEAITFKARRGKMPANKTDDAVMCEYENAVNAMLSTPLAITGRIGYIIFGDEYRAARDDRPSDASLQADQALPQTPGRPK